MFSFFSKIQKNSTDQFITYKFSIEKWMSSWSILIESEISSTIFTSIFKKTSESNNLIFLIIQKTYKIISKLFFMIFSCLINNKIHSHCWHIDIDAILKKIKNSNYFISKLYRIITLLNCLKKISKKIIIKWLLYLKQISNMLDFDQIDERKNWSAIDAIFNLIHDIQLILKQKLITSCFFLNVKKIFDYVSINQLLIFLIKLNLFIQLKNWINNFMSNRSITLTLNDQKQHTRQIKMNISQKSLISLILFFIYIRFLFLKIWIKIWISSFNFINDIQINVSSKNIENNCKTLIQIIKITFLWTDANAI